MERLDMHEKTQEKGASRRITPQKEEKEDSKRKSLAGEEKGTAKKLSARTRRKLPGIMRVLVQLAFFLLAPGAFTAAFGGAKYIFTQFGKGEPLTMNPFVSSLIGLCAFTIVFGRFFCGFACPFGAIGDWIHALYVFSCRKRKKKPQVRSAREVRLLGCVKYLVLAGLLLLNYLGLYGVMRGKSPWDVFSMLTAWNLHLEGYVVGVVLLLLIAVGMFFEERFFCRVLCPMGAIFSLLPVLPIFSLRRKRKNCTPKCSLCTRICPSAIELPEDGRLDVSGDCFQCQKCTANCPKMNIHIACSQKMHGSELRFILLRSALLFLILFLLGKL